MAYYTYRIRLKYIADPPSYRTYYQDVYITANEVEVKEDGGVVTELAESLDAVGVDFIERED
jgi:hypothetical protein